MEGEKRRRTIVEMLKNADAPISGGALAKALSVSRQVIVQDIALIRANNIDIISTTRGYVLRVQDARNADRRVFAVNHEDARTAEELYLIVDNGGCVADVFIRHDVYGRITGELNIRNRRDVELFIQRVADSCSQSLLTLTRGDHYHTVEARDSETLDVIEAKLREQGFLKE